jgi:hypothetical protein
MTDWNFCKVEGMAATSVRDNKAQNRFELDVEGAIAFANYRLAPGAVIITHTETPHHPYRDAARYAAAASPRTWCRARCN